MFFMVNSKDDFEIWFSTGEQKYTVFYKGKVLVNGYRYRDVKSYVE